MFYSFCFNKVPSEAFGIVWMIVDLILCKNRNFCSQSRNFENSQERAFDLEFLHKIDIQIVYVVRIFQNFLSYRGMESFQITTDRSVLNRFCFQCIVSLVRVGAIQTVFNPFPRRHLEPSPCECGK